VLHLWHKLKENYMTTGSVHARLPLELISGMEFLAKVTEKTKSHIIYRAVEQYVQEAMEDYHDGKIAMAREVDPNRKILRSWDEIMVEMEKEKHKNV